MNDILYQQNRYLKYFIFIFLRVTGYCYRKNYRPQIKPTYAPIAKKASVIIMLYIIIAIFSPILCDSFIYISFTRKPRNIAWLLRLILPNQKRKHPKTPPNLIEWGDLSIFAIHY